MFEFIMLIDMMLWIYNKVGFMNCENGRRMKVSDEK